MSEKGRIHTSTILRLKGGDVAAFETIYYQLSQKVFYYAYKLTKHRDKAEEVMQESFIRLWEKRQKIDPEQNFSSFFFSIVHNAAIDSIRKEYRETIRNMTLSEIFKKSEYTTELNLGYSQLQEEYLEAIEKLPEKRRHIFKLSREEGLSNEEIAFKLGISKNTVENQIVNALKFLRKVLKHHLYNLFL